MQESRFANTSRARDRDERGPSRGRGPGYKRLIVATDGTWVNADSGSLKLSDNIPSNVTRMTRAIKPESSDGIQQVVYYHKGVGTSGGIIDKVYGGATGSGLGENVREGYTFIATNYQPADEVYFIGFSRGAFTSRAIAGLIGEVGILTRKGLPFLAEIFHDVQHAQDPDYKPRYPDIPFPNKPSASDPRYREELERRRMTRLDVTIRAIGVWETVGALGTPRISWLEKLGLQSRQTKRMSFYDTKLSNCIENAFQALGLDEHRAAFSPAVWEKMPGNTTRLRQVWFPGVHANIGGGYPDQEIANITLTWMLQQFIPFLDMDLDYALLQQEATDRYYASTDQRPRPWSFGEIYNSLTGAYALGGSTTRTPGRYFVVDPATGRETDEPLRDTFEYIHPSVRTRIRLRGPGVEDKGTYDPPAMKDWKLVVEYDSEDEELRDERGKPVPPRPDVFWKLRTGQRNVSTRILPEALLEPLERELLDMDPEMKEAVFRPAPTARMRESRSGGDRGEGKRVKKTVLRERERSRVRF